jgi:hypothetical protein
MIILHARRLYIGTTAERGTATPPTDVVGTVFYDSDEDKEYYWNGSAWTAYGTGAGGGDVYGDATVTDGHLAVFDVDGYHIKDGGAIPAGGGDVVGPAGASNSHLVLFDGVTGKLLKDGGSVPAGISGSVLEAQVFSS